MVEVEEIKQEGADAELCGTFAPADDYATRELLGVVKQMNTTVLTEPNEWMREQALKVFEKGIRALSDEEVRNMSLEWLRRVPMPNYLKALSARGTGLFD